MRILNLLKHRLSGNHPLTFSTARQADSVDCLYGKHKGYKCVGIICERTGLLARRGKSHDGILQGYFHHMLHCGRAGWFPAPPLPLLLERLKCVGQPL